MLGRSIQYWVGCDAGAEVHPIIPRFTAELVDAILDLTYQRIDTQHGLYFQSGAADQGHNFVRMGKITDEPALRSGRTGRRPVLSVCAASGSLTIQVGSFAAAQRRAAYRYEGGKDQAAGSDHTFCLGHGAQPLLFLQ